MKAFQKNNVKLPHLVHLVLFVPILAFSSASIAACYTVYDKSDKPVYKSSEPPFDLSIPISEGIKSKYPGGYLIQDSQKASCYLRNKSNESFRNRRIQLQSQGFSEVGNERVSILPFPKQVMVVDRPLNTPAFPVTQNSGDPQDTTPLDSHLSARNMPTLTPSNGDYSVGFANQIDSDCRYKSSTGTCYKYDLSKPADQIKYSVDIGAQLHDSINVNPRVDIDRSLGKFGGGIKR